MIADFGLSRVMEEQKLQLLTEICGTPGVRVYPSFNQLILADVAIQCMKISFIPL